MKPTRSLYPLALFKLSESLRSAADYLHRAGRTYIGERWLVATRERFPIGSCVACDCGSCKGRLWWVHSYDLDNTDVRLVPQPQLADGNPATWFGDLPSRAWADVSVLRVVFPLPQHNPNPRAW